MAYPNNTKMLGKIAKAKFGRVGYQDGQFGLQLQFSGPAWGVFAEITGGWDYDIKASKNSKWTEADRDRSMAEMTRKVSQVIRDAKVDTVEELKGIPVEVEFDSAGCIKSWRVLSEVL